MSSTAASIEHLDIDALKRGENNPRTHGAEQIAQIVASIRAFGFTNPVLIDEANGVIAGNARLVAARELAMQRIPCLRLAHLSEVERRAYAICDNRIPLNGSWSMDL